MNKLHKSLLERILTLLLTDKPIILTRKEFASINKHHRLLLINKGVELIDS